MTKSPRQRCRGFIETRAIELVDLPELANPPGNVAGASLKPGLGPDLHDHALHPPGNVAGASLKRDKRMNDRGVVSDPPGNVAGASLKRPLRLAVLAVNDPSPGNVAGASLKRWARSSLCFLQTAFPRQRCRGFIETTP